MMDLLPSSSKSGLGGAEMKNNSEKEIDMIDEVKNFRTPKKRPMKQKRYRRHSSCSGVSRVLAYLKANERSPEDKKAIKKKGKKANLKKFDKPIRKPSDGELLIDLAADEEDVLILQEDDFIEILEHFGEDSIRTRILIDLTEEESTENHKQDSEDIAEDSLPKSKRWGRSMSISAGEEELIDLTENNVGKDSSSVSMVKSLAVTNKETATVGTKESQELEKPGCSSDLLIENQVTMQVDNENTAAGTVQIQEHVEKATHQADPVELCKLFIGGVSEKTTSESLKKYFEKWGEVLDAIIKTDQNTNRSKGFGFVTYTRKHMVDTVQKNRPHIIDGRLVCCRRYLPTKEISYPRGLMKDLFVPELQENIKENDLIEYFRKFGKILKCSIVTHNYRNGPRRFGFISFYDHDSVDEILILRFHKIKGYVIKPRVCLSREQLAERELKYYLKYFGGFNDWPMSAIEEWIRRHPELCHNNFPYQRNIERLRAEASSEMYMWGSYWARSDTCSTSSAVSFSIAHRDFRSNERAQVLTPVPWTPSQASCSTSIMDKALTPVSQTASQASCSTCIMDKEKIKMEIDSDDETDTKLNMFNSSQHLQAVKEEHVSPVDEDIAIFDAQIISKMKTEPIWWHSFPQLFRSSISNDSYLYLRHSDERM